MMRSEVQGADAGRTTWPWGAAGVEERLKRGSALAGWSVQGEESC